MDGRGRRLISDGWRCARGAGSCGQGVEGIAVSGLQRPSALKNAKPATRECATRRLPKESPAIGESYDVIWKRARKDFSDAEIRTAAPLDRAFAAIALAAVRASASGFSLRRIAELTLYFFFAGFGMGDHANRRRRIADRRIAGRQGNVLIALRCPPPAGIPPGARQINRPTLGIGHFDKQFRSRCLFGPGRRLVVRRRTCPGSSSAENNPCRRCKRSHTPADRSWTRRPETR